MQRTNKITAFFFLGLFILMILHQALPHLHHQHADSHSHDIALGSEHHHHDDNSQEKENSPFGFLGFFMDIHVHSTVSSDILLLKRDSVQQQSIVVKDVAKRVFNIKELYWVVKRFKDNSRTYYPPNTYFNPYLYYLDLRGPPSLG